MKLTYPAIFAYKEKNNGYIVRVPDLPGCITEGDSLANAIDMAVDAASGWVLDELEDGKEAPASTDISKIKHDKNEFSTILVLDMDTYAEKYGKKAIRKNTTIPAWLSTFGDKMHVNYSKLLTDALTELYMNTVH